MGLICKFHLSHPLHAATQAFHLRSTHTRGHEVGLLVSLVCLVLFCPRGHFCVGRTSEPPLELRVNAFHWTCPEKGSVCAELLVRDGECDLRPQSHRSFCKSPLWHHYCKIKLFEAIQGKVFDCQLKSSLDHVPLFKKSKSYTKAFHEQSGGSLVQYFSSGFTGMLMSLL